MISTELLYLDREQLLAEQVVLEELLCAKPYGWRSDYWREELARIKDTLKNLAGKPDA